MCHHPSLDRAELRSSFGHGVSEDIGRMKNYLLPIAVVLLAVSPWAKADIVVSLGNTNPGFTNGQHPIFTASVLAAQAGQPAPFGSICGSDTGSGGSTNCSTSWTLPSYSVAGQTITGATLTLGIWDIDSAATGSQVASYQLTGGDDLTALLNADAETVQSVNNEYDVFSVTIPTTSFALLEGGSASISLALQAPGLGALGNSPSNGAGLLYSTLDLQTTPLTATPEPSLLPLLLGGLGAIFLARRLHKRSRANITA